MAKLHPEAINVADIEKYLKDSDDFQLELHVFRSCQAAGMHTSHGGTYKDPVSGIHRQYDVRAFWSRKNTYLRMAIECKATRTNCPLLISRIPRENVESRHYSLITSDALSIQRAKVEPLQTFFPVGKQVGKSTAQIGRTESSPHRLISNDAELFGKWTQAIASAHELVQKALLDCSRDPKLPYAATTIQPILVISDDTLWVADHGSDGARLDPPHQVDNCSLYLGIDVPFTVKKEEESYPITHLLIYTKSGFDAFLQKFANDENFQGNLCIDPIEIRGVVEKKFGNAGL